jgi:hypothetical protein
VPEKSGESSVNYIQSDINKMLPLDHNHIDTETKCCSSQNLVTNACVGRINSKIYSVNVAELSTGCQTEQRKSFYVHRDASMLTPVGSTVELGGHDFDTPGRPSIDLQADEQHSPKLQCTPQQLSSEGEHATPNIYSSGNSTDVSPKSSSSQPTTSGESQDSNVTSAHKDIHKSPSRVSVKLKSLVYPVPSWIPICCQYFGPHFSIFI